MQDTSGTEETAVTPSDALAALEQDRVVDLTASMKLATGSLNPPQTASSLTLSDDGSTGQAKVLTNAEWAFYNKRTGPKPAAPVTKPTTAEMAKIKTWRAEKEAIREKQAKRDAAKQAAVDAEEARVAEEKLEARRKQILERQAVHKQDMQSRAAYFTQVEQGYQEYQKQRSKQEPLFKKMQKAFKSKDEEAEQEKLEQYKKTLQPTKLRTVGEIRKGVPHAGRTVASTTGSTPPSRQGNPKPGKAGKGGREAPAMVSRACSPMVFLSTDRSPAGAGVTPEVSQGGAETYNVEAEQASELAEPSQMTSVAQEQPEASDAAGSGDEGAAENSEAAADQPSAEASTAQPDAQDQPESDASEAERVAEEQSEAPLLGEEAADAEPSQLSLHSSQAREEQHGQDQGEQDVDEGDEVQAEVSEPAAPSVEGSAEPEEQAAGEEDDAPAQEAAGAAEAGPESDPTMESEVEIPIASLSAASVPAEDSKVDSSLPEQEESSQPAVLADAGQDAAEAEPSATDAAPVTVQEEEAESAEPEAAPQGSQEAVEKEAPEEPASAVQASPFSAAAAGMNRLGSHGRTAPVSQSEFLATMSNNMADLERQYSGLHSAGSGISVPYQSGAPLPAPSQEAPKAEEGDTRALRTTSSSSKLLGRMSRASSNLVGRMFPARQSNADEDISESRPPVVPRVPSLNLSRISRG